VTTQAYYDWVADGSPFYRATPVREYVKAFMAAGWPTSSLGTIGNSAHLTASTPQDHCPFSATGWPNPNPYPYVLAFDASHEGVREAQLDAIVTRWVAQARAGHTPWVKYIIYKGHSWGVRSGWIEREASGHYDHVHVSMRTDYYLTSIGVWNPTATTGDTMDEYHENAVLYDNNRLEGFIAGRDVVQGTDYTQLGAGAEIWPNIALKRLLAGVEDLVSRSPVTVDPLAVAQALAAQQPFVDALATAVAAKLGLVPQAREIAKAVGELAWHGKAD
jgi:hypothetical protein